MTELAQDYDGRAISHLVVPLDVALEIMTGPGMELMRSFVRARLVAGDPGPLHVVDGQASTPQFDAEQAHPWNLQWVARFPESR